MPRVAPVTGKDGIPPEHHAAVDHVMSVFNRIRGPFSILLHSPPLADRLLSVGDYFRNDSIVDAKHRALAVLVVARERQAAYVWAAQANAARKSGVGEETIDRLRSKAALSKYPPEEREIVAYAEQLTRANRVDQATFDALKNRYGVKWLVELTAFLLSFNVQCGIVNAFEVPAPEGGDRLNA
jgi:4-carboxymuconolactone decarboxylase